MRIVCMGTHCTGKSTFIKDFIAKYPSYTTPSKTYRDMVKDKGLAINQEGTINNQLEIFNFVKQQQLKLTEPNVIMDRCVFDAMVYTKALLVKNMATNTPMELALFKSMREQAYELLSHFDLIFHFPLKGNEHIVIEKDGLRDTDKQYQSEVDYHFWVETGNWLGQARTRLTNFYWITGTRDERLNYIEPLRNYDSIS